MTTRPNNYDTRHLVDCATNEGDMYSTWSILARRHANTPDSEWVFHLRRYTTRLLRERRIDRTPSAATINAAAAELRDYYIRHLAELGL